MAKVAKQREDWLTNSAKFYAWHEQTREEAIEPDLEIVDPHHHIWDMRELLGFNPFGMMRQQYYMTEELIDDFVGGGHNVTRSVFVTTHAFFNAKADEVMKPLGEVQFVQGIAAQFASGKYGALRCAAGIIGHADLAKFGADVEPLLLACKAASPNYRGIRGNGAHDPNMPKSSFAPSAGLYRDAKFREGFALLAKHGLSFDAWVFSSQLSDVHELACAFPGTSIVLNHVGTPVAALGNVAAAPAYDDQQAQVLASWQEAMARIAGDCPNVVVKVGACVIPQLGSGLDGRATPASSVEVASLLKDIVAFVVATFGAGRCMLESNFPVDKVAVSYTVLWNAYKRLTADLGLSEADRALLFSGTAKRVYRLE